MLRTLLYLLSLCTGCSLAFLPQQKRQYFNHQITCFTEITSRTRRLAKNLDEEDLPIANDAQSNKAWQEELTGRAETLRVEKVRKSLEHQNTQAFLKRKPVKLPYEQARKWVQFNLGVDTQDEFDDLVANGNVRTPYIPKRPEEYYTRTREWISWEHFLTGYHTNQHPSAIRPSDGIFD